MAVRLPTCAIVVSMLVSASGACSCAVSELMQGRWAHSQGQRGSGSQLQDAPEQPASLPSWWRHLKTATWLRKTLCHSPGQWPGP